MEQKITFPSHNLWLSKLLSLDFEIEYKKGKDNTATDTLSRNPKGELFTMVVSLVSTTLMNLIKASWEKGNTTQRIIHDMLQDPNSHPRYNVWMVI